MDECAEAFQSGRRDAGRRIADRIAEAALLRGAEKDYNNLSYQEGYLDALDTAEQIARGEARG